MIDVLVRTEPWPQMYLRDRSRGPGSVKKRSSRSSRVAFAHFVPEKMRCLWLGESKACLSCIPAPSHSRRHAWEARSASLEKWSFSDTSVSFRVFCSLFQTSSCLPTLMFFIGPHVKRPKPGVSALFPALRSRLGFHSKTVGSRVLPPAPGTVLLLSGL